MRAEGRAGVPSMSMADAAAASKKAKLIFTPKGKLDLICRDTSLGTVISTMSEFAAATDPSMATPTVLLFEEYKVKVIGLTEDAMTVSS